MIVVLAGDDFNFSTSAAALGMTDSQAREIRDDAPGQQFLFSNLHAMAARLLETQPQGNC